MGRWRSKFILLLIAYFAGFVTAIYFLAPVPEGRVDGADMSFAYQAFKSDEFAKSFNAGMHRCLDFAKNAAWRTTEFVKNELEDRQSSANRDGG